jgi:cyclopropane fatty-acyl-phospholipid synthase-like methyltransferase
VDIRAEAAQYYDLQPSPFDDISFYKDLVSSPGAHLLELGCGTGRVLVPLSGSCSHIHGIDLSEAMLEICQRKLKDRGIPSSQASVERADITDFHLGARFDLIIAPFRVFQNLESDSQVDGLFRCVQEHLSSSGTCILTAFRPYRDPDTLRRDWQRDGERLNWDISLSQAVG